MLQRLHDERAPLVVVLALLQLRCRGERGHASAGFAPLVGVVLFAGFPRGDWGGYSAGAGIDLAGVVIRVGRHRLLVPGLFSFDGGVESADLCDSGRRRESESSPQRGRRRPLSHLFPDDGEVAQRFLQRADRGRLPYGRCARGRRAHHRRGAHRAADRVRREQPRVSQVRHDVTVRFGVREV